MFSIIGYEFNIPLECKPFMAGVIELKGGEKMMKKVLVMIGLFSLLVGLVSSYSAVPDQGKVALGTSSGERVGVGIIPGVDQSAVGAKLEVLDMNKLVIAEIKGNNQYGAGFDLASYASGGERWRFLVSADGSRAGNLEFQTKLGSDATHMVISKDGNVGIGVTNPERKLHISTAMRLEPTSLPAGSVNGDIYVDISGALCIYLNGWQVVAGNGTCDTMGEIPAITIIKPDGINDIADDSYTITWTDENSDSDASISLYYDTYDAGENGTLIVSGISGDDETDSYVWDTSDISDGNYYVYAVIDNGVSSVVDYSGGIVSVNHIERNWSEMARIFASDGAFFGDSVSIDGDYAIVGACINDKGSAYIFKRDGTNWIEQAKLTVSDGEEGDRFGWSVSIDGDYAIVSAYANDDGKGSAYIFKRDGTNWIEQAKLTASDRGEGINPFGVSVSIDGDYAIVGADVNLNDGLNRGSAYIFKRDGTNWVEQTKINASDGVFWNEFGVSVSIDGDYAIVGAHYDNEKGEKSGSVYIFYNDGTNWTEQTKITASDGMAGDNFGVSVSIDDDYVVVGANGYNGGRSRSGSAYIFKRDGTNWVEQTKLTASDEVISNFFGWSVSIDGNYVIVSAVYDDEGNVGSVYIFERNGTDWSQDAKITKDNEVINYGFKNSVPNDYATINIDEDWKIGLVNSSSIIEVRSGRYTPFFGYFVSISGEHALVSSVEYGLRNDSAYVYELS